MTYHTLSCNPAILMQDSNEKYKGMTQRDLLIELHGKMDMVVGDIGDLKGEDLRLHTRITDEVQGVHQRVDRVSGTYKYITAGFLALTAVGGVLAAIFG